MQKLDELTDKLEELSKIMVSRTNPDSDNFQRDFNLAIAEWRGEMKTLIVATKEDVDAIKNHLTDINQKLGKLSTQVTKIKTQAAILAGGLTIILTGIINFVLKLV